MAYRCAVCFAAPEYGTRGHHEFMFCQKTLIQELSKEEARHQPSAAEWLAAQDARARAMQRPAESPPLMVGPPVRMATTAARRLPRP